MAQLNRYLNKRRSGYLFLNLICRQVLNEEINKMLVYDHRAFRPTHVLVHPHNGRWTLDHFSKSNSYKFNNSSKRLLNNIHCSFLHFIAISSSWKMLPQMFVLSLLILATSSAGKLSNSFQSPPSKIRQSFVTCSPFCLFQIFYRMRISNPHQQICQSEWDPRSCYLRKTTYFLDGHSKARSCM